MILRKFLLLGNSSFQICASLATRYRNSSTTATSTNGVGDSCEEGRRCLWVGGIGGTLTFDQILTTTGPTIVYTIDPDMHNTIGSSLSHTNITTDFVDYKSLLGFIEGPDFLVFETLNTVTTSWNTLIHTVDVAAVDYSVYRWFTDAGGRSYCALDTDIPPALENIPPQTISSAFHFNHENPDASYMVMIKSYGDSYMYSLFSEVLGGPSSCDYLGGGAGELKIGVSILTATSTAFAAARVITSSPTISTISQSTVPHPGGVVSPIYPPSTSSSQIPQPTKPPQDSPPPPNNPPVVQPSSKPSPQPTNNPSGGQPAPQPHDVPSASSQAPNNGPLPVVVVSPVTTSIKIGTSTPTVVILPSKSGYIIEGTPLRAGSPPITYGGAIISVDSSGIKTFSFVNPIAAAIASIINASPLPNPAGAIMTPAPTPQVIPGSSIIIEGQTLTSGGNIVVDGVSYSLNPSGTALVVGGSSIIPISAISSMLPGQNGGAIAIAGQTLVPGSKIVVNGQAISLDPSNSIVVYGETLKPGSTVAVNSQTLSLNQAGNSIIIGGSTLPIASLANTNNNNALIIGSQTLKPGEGILIGSQTISLPAFPTNGPYISLSGVGKISIQTIQSGVVISGQTLTSGGNIVIGGQTLSFASGGTSGFVVGGSSTVGFSSSVAPNGGLVRGNGSNIGFTGAAGRNVDVVGWLWVVGAGVTILAYI